MTQEKLEEMLTQSKRQTRSVEKGSGDEFWMTNNCLYCGKILRVTEAHQGSKHYHFIKDETFYILSGQILMEVYGGVKVMNAGDVLRIEPGTIHRFSNLSLGEPAEIIEISTEHSDDDTYRVEGTVSGPIPEDELLDLRSKYLNINE